MGLFAKGWQTNNEAAALSWVKAQKGTKRALADAAMKAPSYHVRAAAVEQLESQSLLKLVVESEDHTDSNIKSFALRKITDQAFLSEFARKGWEAAIESLTDTTTLMQILTDPNFFQLRGDDEVAIYYMSGERGRKIQRQDQEKKEKLATTALRCLDHLSGHNTEMLRAATGNSSYKCARRYRDTGQIS